MTDPNEKTIAMLNNLFEVFVNSEAEIRPHCIVTGETGSGKSWTISELAKKFNLPAIEISAAQLTAEGLSGNSLSKALSGLLQIGNQPAICFVDEFDKLFLKNNAMDDLATDVTAAVQNEFLKLLESTKTQVFGNYGKYISVPCDKVLFIFAGSFNGAQVTDHEAFLEFGIRPEFLGRVSINAHLQKSPLEVYFNLIEQSELITQYCRVLQYDHKTAIEDIKKQIEIEFKRNIIGFRLITQMTHQYFLQR
jgi:ATP-dependent protease Clp ATPase subunit